jgi:hypothetical protein
LILKTPGLRTSRTRRFACSLSSARGISFLAPTPGDEELKMTEPRPGIGKPDVACLLAFALLVAGCASSPDEFAVHRKQAIRDSRTPEARAYERDLYPAIGQNLATLLQKCTTEFSAAEIDSFEMVFKIDHWGEPKAILVDPVTGVSECVAKGFWYFTFPHPAARFEKTGLVLLLPVRIR